MFIINFTSPSAIMSAMLGCPSLTLFAFRQATPEAASVLAVPPVLTMSKPIRAKSRAIDTMDRLSRSATLTNTAPDRGRP